MGGTGSLLRARGAIVAVAVAVAASVTPAQARPTPVWVARHPVQGDFVQRVAAIPDGAAWAVVDGDQVLRSTDFGNTWSPVVVDMSVAAGGGSVEIAPVSATSAYAAVSVSVLRTSDAGATWEPVSVPKVSRTERASFTDSMRYTGGALWIARDPMEPDADGCPRPADTTALLSTPDGRSWARRDIPFRDGGIDVVAFRDARHGVAVVAEYVYDEPERDGDFCVLIGVSERSGVYVTHDGGRVWRRTFECEYHCNGAAWVDARRIVLGRADGTIFVSGDAGRHFAEAGALAGATSTPVDELDGLDCVGASCFASVIGRGMFRSNDGGATWGSELSDKVVVTSAYGNLSMFDADRAVAFGASSLVTREHLATPSGRPARAFARGRSPVRDGSGAWRLPDGTRRRVVRLPR